MNTPMLYWFIPRGVFHFFDWLLLGAFLLWLVWLIRKLRKPAPRHRYPAAVLLAITAGLAAWWGYGNYQDRKAWEAGRAYSKAAWAHFRKRCESAHVTYYKTVPPQDGVFIMKPAKSATVEQLKDQYWMGDPYDLPDAPEDEAEGLLYRKKSLPKGSWDARHGEGGFDFVEVEDPKNPGAFVRYLLAPNGETDQYGNPIHKVGSQSVPVRQSRYGYTWDDISTKEDRYYWVAGGRMQVVDLTTGEVVAERVGYVIERYFGVTGPTFNQTPWSSARMTDKATCPKNNRLDTNGLRGFFSVALGTWNELQLEGENK